MKVILCINHESLQNYIKNLDGIEVTNVLVSKKNLLSECETNNPDIVVIAHNIVGEGDINQILTKLTVSTKFLGRIIYLYGEDNSSRKKFVNSLIMRGIYDYSVGELNGPIIKELIYKVKNRNDVKQDLFENSVDNYLSEATEFENEKQEIKFVDRILEIEVEVPVEKIVTKEIFITKEIRQQTYAIYSLYNNTIKNMFISNLAITLSEKSDHNILVIDFDMPFPSLDHHFGISKEIYINELHSSKELTGLSGCISAIDKNLLNKNTFNEFVKQIKGYDNLFVLTGLYDLDVIERIDESYIHQIIEYASDNFTTVLLSLNPFMYGTATYTSLINAYKIIMVSENTYTNGRANLSFVEEFTTNQGRNVEDFHMVIFGDGLDKEKNNELYKNIDILGYIKSNYKYIDSLNNKKPLVCNSNKKDEEEYEKIMIKLGYLPKESFLTKLIKKLRKSGE